MFLLDLNASDIGTENGFCHNTAVVWQFLGRIVLILKIVIPVLADDDKEIKTQVNKLITKFIAAVVIFFLPSIVGACFRLVNGFSSVEADYMVCVNCVTNPQNECQVPE